MTSARLLLKGSCHCGAVKFRLRSAHIFPYQRCYCSICRKTQGSGGYSINLSGDARTLKVTGRKNIAIYHAVMRERGKRPYRSTGERAFCKLCGSYLWVYSPEWPDLIHPFASAIDTPLPPAPETTHLLLKFIAPWVVPQVGRNDKKFQEFPEESIEEWHKKRGLENRKS